jgi:hypothetical protein
MREWAVAPAIGEAAAAAAADSEATHPLVGLYSSGSSSTSPASASSSSNMRLPQASEAAVGADRSGSVPPSWQDVQVMEGRITRHMRLLERIEANLDGAPHSSAAVELDGSVNESRTYEQDKDLEDRVSESDDMRAKRVVVDESIEADEPITLKACMVCMDAPASATFVHGKSGHTVCCLECAEMIHQRQGTCPICSQEVSLVIRNYFN